MLSILSGAAGKSSLVDEPCAGRDDFALDLSRGERQTEGSNDVYGYSNCHPL